jgi:hypothetical protein
VGGSEFPSLIFSHNLPIWMTSKNLPDICQQTKAIPVNVIFKLMNRSFFSTCNNVEKKKKEQFITIIVNFLILNEIEAIPFKQIRVISIYNMT